MSCAACAAHVEKAVSSVPGVLLCVVNLLTNLMGVEGTAGDGDVIAAVERAGYGARAVDAPSAAQENEGAGAVLPGDKESTVRDLQRGGAVVMAGDGINDAPAPTAADVGVAIGAGADIASGSADVVLVQSSLSRRTPTHSPSA